MKMEQTECFSKRRHIKDAGELPRKKHTIRFIMAGRPSVHVEQLVSYCKDFHENLIFEYFSKLFQEKLNFH